MPEPGHEPPVARLRFARPPSAAPVFLRALSDRRPARLEEGATAGRIEGAIDGLRWPGKRLGRYRQACGIPDAGNLPTCFPHVLAAGLHARMLMRPEFPVRLPGLIHVWHEIRQHRSLVPDERLEMKCVLEGHRDVEAGAEFCLHTSVLAGGSPVWEEDTGFISRSVRRARRKGTAPSDAPPGVFRPVDEWSAERGVGRRYAMASGDYNPIHLFDAAARKFGFPAAIAHGMWTLARTVAGLEQLGEAPTRSVRVKFRRPVLIPATLRLMTADQTNAGMPFEVREIGSGNVVLDGRWTARS